jgi:transketolase
VEVRLGGVFASHLARAADTDARIWVLDADLADSDGADRFAAQHPARFVNAGIAEQAMISAAAGLAACDARPFAFSFAAFLCYRAYDQIRTSVSQTGLPVTLVGSHAGGCGDRNGKTHVALTDVAIMSLLPHFDVWAPGDRWDAEDAAAQALARPGPCYVRLPRSPLGFLPAGSRGNRWLGPRTDVALCSSGLATSWALETQTLLAQSGIEVGVLHLPHLWSAGVPGCPRLLDSVEAVLAIDDHSSAGGLGELLRRGGFEGVVEVAGWPSDWSGQSGSDEQLRRHGGLDAATLAARFRRLVGRCGGTHRIKRKAGGT